MPDVFDPKKRSEVMSLIRSKDTKAEKIAFKYLRQQKIYFQKHYKKAPGKPDIALPRKKKAIFIDGDFWHGKTFEQLQARRPKGDYWLVKIARNMKRDNEQEALLRANGWRFLRIWEEELLRKKTQQETLSKIVAFLASDS